MRKNYSIVFAGLALIVALTVVLWLGSSDERGPQRTLGSEETSSLSSERLPSAQDSIAFSRKTTPTKMAPQELPKSHIPKPTESWQSMTQQLADPSSLPAFSAAADVDKITQGYGSDRNRIGGKGVPENQPDNPYYLDNRTLRYMKKHFSNLSDDQLFEVLSSRRVALSKGVDSKVITEIVQFITTKSPSLEFTQEYLELQLNNNTELVAEFTHALHTLQNGQTRQP